MQHEFDKLTIRKTGVAMANKIIIIGNGIAGISALRAMREVDKASEIYIFGDETFYPYYRLKLSKGLFDGLSEDSLLILKKDWYKENNVNLYLDKKVTGICLEKREVILSDESALVFDKLLFANGAGNFKPPVAGINNSGVFSLRTLQDALHIKSQIEKNEKVIVIGGGIQGLEIAWSLHQYGAGVSLVELQPRLMQNQLDERASEILRQSIEAFGVNIYLNTRVGSISGSSSAEGITTNDGEILPCSKVIYSVGIVPNIDIVRNTSVKFRKGIIVNEKMETNVEGIYAAGDVAEFNNTVAGAWNTSMNCGKVAGYNIAGRDSVYHPIVPFTTLNAFNVTLSSIGCVDAEKSARTFVEETAGSRYVKIFINNEKISGAIVIGDTKRSQMLKSAIEKGMLPESLDLSTL